MDHMNSKDALPSDDHHKECGNQDELNTPLVLTDRDLALMCLAHEERFLAYSHIKDGFWPDQSRESNAARRRIRRLIEEGYLGKYWIERRSELVYLLGERGHQLLTERNLDQGLRLYRYNEIDDNRIIDHNRKVVNIRLLFRNLGIPNWTSERVLKERERKYFYPDGVLHLRGEKIAVEFENGLKCKRRYVERFATYGESKEYSLAIFVVDGIVRDWLIDLDYRLDRICFIEYDHLTRAKANAEFENKASRFALAEIL